MSSTFRSLPLHWWWRSWGPAGSPSITQSRKTSSRNKPSAWFGWLAIWAVLIFPIVEIMRIVVQHQHVTMYGDQALMEFGARRAWHLHQLVGPYSRFGFHHPGPTVFYLLAPFVSFFGTGGPGLYVGAIVINAATLGTTVGFLWRRFGVIAALWAAGALDVYCLCIGLQVLREPWNPYLVILPMVLFVVLWAARITGAKGTGIWALIVGSYLAQTEIATAGFVLLMLAILGAQMGLRRNGHVVWNRWFVAGCIVFALIWLVPLVELLRNSPNNLHLLSAFFLHVHDGTPIDTAVRTAANAVTIVPFGLLVVGTIVFFWLDSRGPSPMARALMSAGVFGVVAGTLSFTGIAGPSYPYLAMWLAFVPLSVLLAIGVALPVVPERGIRPMVVVSLAVVILMIVSDLRMGGIATTTGSGPWPLDSAGSESAQTKEQTIRETKFLTHLVQNAMLPEDNQVVLNIGTDSLWPYVAGIVLALDESGVQATVTPVSWDLYFGATASMSRPTVMFDLSLSADSLGVVVRSERIKT